MPTAGSAASPTEALELTERRRSRTFAIVTLLIAIAFGVALLFLPPQPIVTPIMWGGIGTTLGAMLYLIYQTSKSSTSGESRIAAIAWYVPVFAVASSILYAGPFSPIVGLCILGLYIIGMGSRPVLAMAVYVTTALASAIAGVVVIAGLGDPGLVKAAYLPTYIQVVIQILIQVVLLGSFVVARASRRSSLAAFTELERAVRGVAQREALLEEARQELRRALGTGRGRFTEQTFGSYRLGDLIGRGAMGEVYGGVDVRSGGAVAVKLLTMASLSNPSHVQRFFRELRTCASIDSPHVVRVLAVGEEPLPHLVMERLHGRDLSAILRDTRLLPPDQVKELVVQVAAGLSAANTIGIVHRDIKPQNLFLDNGMWKILDFGVARYADSGDTLTAGHVVGTPTYMAPEQARGQPIDHRADLYSLAAVAYRALTAHALFSGDEVVDILYRVVHTQPRRPTSLANLPADIDLVLAIGLSKRPENRFDRADELAAAIAAALDGTLPETVRQRGAALVAAGAWSQSRRRDQDRG